jgi:hypothetical protein
VGFWHFRVEELNDAEDAQKIRSSGEALRRLWAAVYVAEKMGEGLERGEILLGRVPDAEAQS